MAAANGRQGSWARRLWLLGVSVAVALAACSDQKSTVESVGEASEALTSAQTRILGFESVGSGSTDWTTTSGTLSQSTRHVEGAKSLAIANGGNAEIKSAALSSLGPVADKITLDLLLPAAQPNPNWMGTVKLVIECPSQQIYYEGLVEYQLQGRPTEQFLRFEFPLSASTQQKLSTGTYSDLRFKILLNVAAGAGPWLLDRLSVGDTSSGGGGGSGGVAGSSGTGGAGMSGGGQGGTNSPPSSNAAILGFESPALWSGSAGVLTSSDVRLEGAYALQVADVGYVELTSAPLTTLGPISSVIGFDLSVPNPAGDVGWWGSAAVAINCPSRGINNRWIGQQELNGATLNRYRRVEVALPDDVKATLSTGSYADLQVKVILTVPVGSGPYLLDRFTFNAQLPEPAPPAPSDAVDKALGMETLESWKATAATLRLSSAAAERTSALAVSDFQYTQVTSTRLSTLGGSLNNELTLDVWIPVPPTPSWAGSIGASISIPSKGINSQFIGQQDVLTLEKDAWQRVRFPMTPALVAALQGSYSDLRFELALTRPAQVKPWLIDRVSLGQKPLSPPTPAFTETYVVPLPSGSGFGTVAIGQALVRSAPFFRAGGAMDILGSPQTAIRRADGQFSEVVAPRGIDDDEASVLVGLGASVGGVAAFSRVNNDGTIHGNARAGGVIGGSGSVLGAVSQHIDLLSREAGKLTVAFPDGSGKPDITVIPGGAVSPAPGTYDFVSSSGSGSITLRTGSYYINHLSIGRGTELRLDNTNGPVLVHVRDSFAARGSVSLLDQSKWNALFVVTARDDVKLAHDTHFEGTIVAPKTNLLRIDPQNDPSEPAYTAGSFFGRSVFAGYAIEHHPFVREDCGAGSCGVFGCDTADRDGDGLYDCQEQSDNDPFTDPDRFNGLRAYGYRSSHRSVNPAAIDTQAEVDASIAEKFEEHDIYSGWDLDGNALLDVGCQREMAFWPPWPVCHETSYPAFNYSGFIKLATSGQHCFQVSETSTSIAGALFLGDEPGLTSSDGKRCMTLEAGVYPLRFMVEVVGLQDINSLADDRFKVAYCAGNCDPVDAIPQGMLRPEDPLACSSDSQCQPAQFCSQGGRCRDEGITCQTASDCAPNDVCGNGACVPSCAAAADCSTGSTCSQGGCVPNVCLGSSRSLACGYEGAPCTCEGQCQRDDDCSDGNICIPNDGSQPNLPSDAKVCRPPVCVPNCADKVCGDADLGDGCGGVCAAVCDTDDTGCVRDADCVAGSVCRSSACVPADPCDLPNLAPPNCGAGSICGDCPPPIVSACADRVCGLDPGTGANCGGCSADHFCNGAGQCALLEKTPPISVPGLDNEERVVVPDQGPAAPALFGATSGAFSVTDRGSASYQIAIDVPPGRAGIEPALGLRYNSSTGNGALGAGWSLDGFSSVARCPRTYAQDGYVSGVRGKADDALCLDGQRLVPTGPNEYRTEIDTFAKVKIEGMSGTGPLAVKVYGKDGRILTFGGSESSRSILRQGIVGAWYLSRVEDRSGNFMRVTYEQSTRVDQVTSDKSTSELVPSAVTYTGFGATDGDREVLFTYDSARPDMLDGFRVGGGAFARIRRLTNVDVRAQNTLVRRYSFTYEVAQNGASRVASMQECAGTAAAACKNPTKFEYFDEGGFEEGVVKVIPLEEGRSLPPSIAPYGIVHKSSEGRDTLNVLSLSQSEYYVTPLPIGIDMPVALIPGAGPYAAKGIQLIQVLGMQRRHDNWFESYEFDLVASQKLFGNHPCDQTAPIRHLVGNGSFGAETIRNQCPVVRSGSPAGTPFIEKQFVVYARPQWLIDLDGDGVQDALYCAEEGGPGFPLSEFRPTHLDYKLAKASASATPTPPTDAEATHENRDGEITQVGDLCTPPHMQADERPFSMLFDVDGDGAPNLVYYDKSFRWLALVKSDSGAFEFRPEFGLLGIQPNKAHIVTTMDVNGDGLRDILAEPAYKVNEKLFGVGEAARVASHTPILALNTGRGFRSQLLTPQDPVNGGRAAGLPAYAVDLDHDGIDELVMPGSDSEGAKATWRKRRVVNGTLVEEPLEGLTAGPGVLGDFDGDGNIDAFTLAKGESHLIHRGRGRRQNLLKSVTDGSGHKVDVAYDDKTPDGTPTYSKYLASGHCSWPQRCLARVEHALVSGHQESHFEDQARSLAVQDARYSYTYGGARVDVAGYGWLGFNERDVVVRDADGEFLHGSHTQYVDPDPWDIQTSQVPYIYTQIGLPTSTLDVLPHADSPLSFASNDHLQISKEFEWTEATSAAGRPFVYLSKTTAITTNLVDASTARPLFRRVAESLEDGYGNVVEERITSDDLGANGTAIPGTQTKQRIQTRFEPTTQELASWLISLPKERIIDDTPRCSGTSECLQKTQQRVQTLMYYPNTDLLHFAVRQPGDPSLQVTTELMRDDKGNVTGVSLTNGEGDVREVTSEFDQRGLYPISLTRVGEATSQTTQVRLDDRFGKPVAQADPNGIDQTWSYDAFGVQRTHHGPSGNSQIDYAASDFYETTDGFDLPAAYRVVTAKAGGERVEQEYNSFGRLVRRKSFGFKGAEVFEELAYDARQRLYLQRRPHLADDDTQGAILFGYDELDRLVSEEFPDGALIEHQYGALGSLGGAFADPWLIGGGLKVTRTFDARSNATVQVTDRDDVVVHAVDALGQGTRYAYGAFGQLARITDSAERSIALVQDAFGRTLQTYDLAEGGWRTSEYDGFDDLKKTTDAGNRIRDYQYDAYGRLIETNDDDGTTTWTFDGDGDNEIGRLVQTTSPTGQTRAFHYEAREAERNRGLPLKVTDTITPVSTPAGTPRTFVTTYHYDDESRLDRVDYPSAGSTAVAVKYSFDAYGHPISVQNADAPEQVYWEALNADQGYRIRQERFGTHSCGAANGTTTTRGYSPVTGSLTSVQTACGANTLQSLTYGYDLAGNLTDRSDALAGTYEGYEYDSLNRPTRRRTSVAGAFQPLYSYDPQMGRLTSQVGLGSYSYSADGRDWIEDAGTNHYEHDAVGNIKTRTGPGVPGGSQTIDYTTLDLPSRITSTSGVTEFAYDSAGRRAVKQTPTSTTFYQGGVYQRTETESATDNRFTIYSAGRAIAEVSTSDTGAPAVTYLHADVLGSVQSVSTSAGALATTRNYGPFGALQSAPPGQPVTPYGFTGHEGDDELGLINMKGRMYDPTLGQFLSADPIIQQPFSQGLNRFAYVNNSPLNFTDPSGFECRGRSGRGCSASVGSAFAPLGPVAGVVGGAVAIGAVAHLGAGPTAIGGGAPRGGGDGAAQGLASLGPEGSGAAQPGAGFGNLLAPVDAAVWNNEMFGNSKPPTVSTMKPAGNANVGSNGGTPGRGAVSKDSAAPVQEGKPPAAIPKQLADRSRFAGAEYAILRKLKGPGGPDRAGALDIANRFWDAPDRGIYDHTVEGYAVTNRDRGSGALAISYGTKTFQSPRSLISTVYHESVIHGGQSRAGNYARQHTKGDAINEIEAYDAELRLAPLTGISSDEIDELTGLRQEYYDELFGTSLRGQVDSGDFTVPEGDLAP